MGLITQRSEGGAQIPPGEKLRFGIKSAAEDWGDHGPQAKFELKVLDGEHEGDTILDWSKLAQPRLDFVRALRGKDYDDKAIAEILRERGYEFEDIDEPEDELMIADGGKLFNICMAAFDGQVKVIDSFDTITDLLDALVGRSFVSITKKRGKNGDYVGITWDMIYPDPDADFEAITL
jgi:hypothetical protein